MKIFLVTIVTILTILTIVPFSLQTIRMCPLGNISEIPEAYCYEDTTCAIFDNNEPLCIGWARNICAMREYRDLKTCYCIKCPANTGNNCYPGNECCSLEECGAEPQPQMTPKRQALSTASRITTYTYTYIYTYTYRLHVLCTLGSLALSVR